MTGVPTRIPALRQPVVGFAHRGARAHAAENSMEAFRLALRLGAGGIDTEMWRTADGRIVLDATGVVGGRLRRRAVGSVDRAELPDATVELGELLHAAAGHEVFLDVRDPDAVAEAIATARDLGGEVESRLWLGHADTDQLASWRPLSSSVRLVHLVRLRTLRPGPEPHAAQLRRLGIDAVRAHHSEWSGGLTTLFHRFGILTVAEDAQFERVMAELVDSGIDAVSTDHVDRMVDVLARFA